jgi:tetratricopeptide (TPR) repeat protein
LAASDRSIQKALELNPRDTEAIYWYMWNLSARGRHKEAIATCEKALEIDPLSDIALHHLCLALWIAGEIQRAEEESRKLVVRSPDLWLGHMGLGWVLLEGNDPQEAIDEMKLAVKLSGRLSWALSGLGRAYASAGKRADALRILDELEARSQTENVSALHLAALDIALGEYGKAIEKVREMAERREPVFQLHFHTSLRPLWKEPAFIELVNQAGVAQYNPETKRFDAVVQKDHPREGIENHD